MTKNKVVNAFLAYRPSPAFRSREHCPNFSTWSDLSSESKKLLAKNANAFFIAMLFDHQITAGKAWEVPAELKRRMGHLEIRRISEMSPSDLNRIIARKPALHRFPKKMALRLRDAAQRIVEHYEGKAENIWKKGNPDAATIDRRLNEFNGVGSKLAHMFLRLLVEYYGRPLKGYSAIDVAVDRHVARVFLRSGLVEPPAARGPIAIDSVKDAIVACARRAVPNYPAALDEPAFSIGREWCTAAHPYCDGDVDEEEVTPCPLSKVCARNTKLQVA